MINVLRPEPSQKIYSIKICDLLCAYQVSNPGQRLLLPPIQRSIVWNNARIIDYWDTLFRGWFPGLIMVREVKSEKISYRPGQETKLENTEEGDLELFDGQQRLATILLGYGEGPFSRTHRLWIGVPKPEKNDNIRFRVTTTGQPFGYQVSEPNQKLPVKIRREALQKYLDRCKKNKECEVSDLTKKTNEIFENVTTEDIAGGENWIWKPLEELLKNETHDEKDPSWRCAIEKLRKVSSLDIAVKRLEDREIDDYEEFFRRIGQGGVALSDDEFVYSIIKNKFPIVRPEIENIINDNEIGQLANPTDLVLAALRVARIRTSDPNTSESARVSRPSPQWVRDIPSNITTEPQDHSEKSAKVFLSWISHNNNDDITLKTLLKKTRSMLSGRTNDSDENQQAGMSSILLARLPKELIDLALILESLKPFENLNDWQKRAFCFWTMYFADSTHSAWQIALHASQQNNNNTSISILPIVMQDLESWGKSCCIPSEDEFLKMENSINHKNWPGCYKLLKSSEQFTESDTPNRKPSVFLQHLTFSSNRGKNLMLFLQREYIKNNFPNYDPTSDRDDDLPIDFDHIVPSARFGVRKGNGRTPQGLNQEQLENFWNFRSEIGNLVGNLRWLTASDNRSRGDGGGANDCLLGENDLTACFPKIQTLVCNLKTSDVALGLSGWTCDELYLWQKQVMLRQIWLARKFLKESKIYDLSSST